MSGLKLFISFVLTSLGISFIKTKVSSWSFLFTYTILPKPYVFHLKNHMPMSLGYMLSLIKFCDSSWFYFVYTLDWRLYIQMNLMLLKYYLTIVFKERERERDEKMACQRSMTQQIKSDMKRSMYLSVH